jgi:hypothetical protein
VQEQFPMNQPADEVLAKVSIALAFAIKDAWRAANQPDPKNVRAAAFLRPFFESGLVRVGQVQPLINVVFGSDEASQ